MKQRLHVHFGIHRTGTTSIHNHLFGNLPALRKMGIFYPALGVGHRHVKLAWHLISKKIMPTELLEQLKNESPKNARLTILSSEDFSLMQDMGWLDVLSGEYEITGSIYLKRQDAWLESWYNQSIKWPWNKKFSSATPAVFLSHLDDFHWINYETLLNRINSHIPRENMYVNVVDSAGVRDTVGDFLQHCGIDMALLEPSESKNESISAARLDIVRRIDLLEIKPLARRKILAALSRLDIEEDDGSKTVFDDDQVKTILDRFASTNMAVAREYFGREQLFLDPVKVGRSPPTIPDRKAYRVYIPQLLKEVASA